MIPEKVKIKNIELVARTVRTNNEAEFNSAAGKIMSLWMSACQTQSKFDTVFFKYAVEK